MKLKNLLFLCVAMVATLMGWSCEKAEVTPPVNIPSIGIHEPEFDKESMTLKVLIAPSTDATAWYWSISAQGEETTYTKVASAAADEVSAKVEYGVEYTIAAYAENEAGKSEVATKRYCPMPEAAEVAIGEVTLDEATMTAKCTVYPSALTVAWYWKAAKSDAIEAAEWQKVEGNAQTEVSFAYTWGEEFEVRAYAENAAGKSKEKAVEAYFEPEAAALTIGDPVFDSEKMVVTVDITPSATTAVWFWRLNPDGQTNEVKGNEPKTLSFNVEYDTVYNISLHAENVLGKSAEGYIVEFKYDAPLPAMVEMSITKATAYTISVDVTKAEHCVRYVVGGVTSASFDAETFTAQAKSSLSPDPSYPIAIYNSATESATFTEQNLVRNSKVDSTENSGLVLIQGEKYTIAVYAEDKDGRSELYTVEHTVPEASEGASFGLDLTMSKEQVGMSWAKATVAAPAGSKLFVGYMDYVSMLSDEAFSFEGKSEAECKAYIMANIAGIPAEVSATKEYTLSEALQANSKYVAYAVAVDPNNEVINVDYEIFTTTSASLSGKATITDAYISDQTSIDELSMLLYVDSEASKVRVYAAPAADHASYADNMEQIMDSDEYQNYREEYELLGSMGFASVDIAISHPGADYYIYAVALDKDGKAGPIVNVAQLAGGSKEYYTTVTEVEESEDDDSGSDSGDNSGNKYDLFFVGTGSVEIAIEVDDTDPDAISAKFTLVSKSDNVKGVWLHRINEAKTSAVKGAVYNDFEYYGYDESYPQGTSSMIKRNLMEYTSYTEEYMIPYGDEHGGTIISVVVADSDNKISINYCYAAGVGEVEP